MPWRSTATSGARTTCSTGSSRWSSARSSDRRWAATGRSIRRQVIAARRVMLRHPWARRVLEERGTAGPAFLAYIESILAILLDGGFSLDLAHHTLQSWAAGSSGSPRTCSTTGRSAHHRGGGDRPG